MATVNTFILLQQQQQKPDCETDVFIFAVMDREVNTVHKVSQNSFTRPHKSFNSYGQYKLSHSLSLHVPVYILILSLYIIIIIAFVSIGL